MQRSLSLLREQGWTCGIVEKFNVFAKIRIDLFGFVDILCLREGKMLAVQTTTATHLEERKNKILANPNYPLLKSTGCGIELHGWGKYSVKNKNGKRSKRKIWRLKEIKL